MCKSNYVTMRLKCFVRNYISRTLLFQRASSFLLYCFASAMILLRFISTSGIDAPTKCIAYSLLAHILYWQSRIRMFVLHCYLLYKGNIVLKLWYFQAVKVFINFYGQKLRGSTISKWLFDGYLVHVKII